MRVRLATAVRHDGTRHEAGAELELPIDCAAALVAQGAAEAAEPVQPVQPADGPAPAADPAAPAKARRRQAEAG